MFEEWIRFEFVRVQSCIWTLDSSAVSHPPFYTSILQHVYKKKFPIFQQEHDMEYSKKHTDLRETRIKC